jgi:hypothetical protein
MQVAHDHLDYFEWLQKAVAQNQCRTTAPGLLSWFQLWTTAKLHAKPDGPAAACKEVAANEDEVSQASDKEVAANEDEVSQAGNQEVAVGKDEVSQASDKEVAAREEDEVSQASDDEVAAGKDEVSQAGNEEVAVGKDEVSQASDEEVAAREEDEVSQASDEEEAARKASLASLASAWAKDRFQEMQNRVITFNYQSTAKPEAVDGCFIVMSDGNRYNIEKLSNISMA